MCQPEAAFNISFVTQTVPSKRHSRLRAWHARLGHRDSLIVTRLLNLKCPRRLPFCQQCVATKSKANRDPGGAGEALKGVSMFMENGALHGIPETTLPNSLCVFDFKGGIVEPPVANRRNLDLVLDAQILIPENLDPLPSVLPYPEGLRLQAQYWNEYDDIYLDGAFVTVSSGQRTSCRRSQGRSPRAGRTSVSTKLFYTLHFLALILFIALAPQAVQRQPIARAIQHQPTTRTMCRTLPTPG